MVLLGGKTIRLHLALALNAASSRSAQELFQVAVPEAPGECAGVADGSFTRYGANLCAAQGPVGQSPSAACMLMPGTEEAG